MRSCLPRLLLLALCALLASAGTAQARSLRQFPSFGGAPPAPASSQCLDQFKVWLEGSATCSGTAADCCTGLLDLGESCWQEVLDSVAGDQQLTEAAITLFQGCGLTVTPVDPLPPTNTTGNSSTPLDVPRCVDDFDAALNTTCSSAGDTVSCCNSLSALGGQCLSHLAASMAATPDLASLLTAFTGQLGSCRIPLPGSDGTAPPAPPSPASPTSGGRCFDSFEAALSSSCAATDLTPCCNALELLGESCLEEVGTSVMSDPQLMEAFTALLQGCGYSVSTYSHLAKKRSLIAGDDADAAAALGSAASLRSLPKPQPGCALCGEHPQQLASAGPVARRSALVTSPSFRGPHPELLQKLGGASHN